MKRRRLRLRSTGKARMVANAFHNPHMPSLDDPTQAPLARRRRSTGASEWLPGCFSDPPAGEPDLYLGERHGGGARHSTAGE
ncbi:MAG: hypothetical protein GY856_39425, partial [bacterium]|nr:hypothetical protein [bacterium]